MREERERDLIMTLEYYMNFIKTLDLEIYYSWIKKGCVKSIVIMKTQDILERKIILLMETWKLKIFNTLLLSKIGRSKESFSFKEGDVPHLNIYWLFIDLQGQSPFGNKSAKISKFKLQT